MILALGLSKEQYQKLRTNGIRRNADIYPPYDQVLDAKKDCTPPNVQCSPDVCVVPMQDVVNHQVVISRVTAYLYNMRSAYTEMSSHLFTYHQLTLKTLPSPK